MGPHLACCVLQAPQRQRGGAAHQESAGWELMVCVLVAATHRHWRRRGLRLGVGAPPVRTWASLHWVLCWLRVCAHAYVCVHTRMYVCIYVCASGD